MRLRTINLLILLFILLSLAGCTDVRQTLRDARIPTIGPVQAVAGQPASGTIELSSNTNCAEIGEIITFTVRIRNETTGTLTITGTPLIDIVLQPARWTLPGPMPVQRWSASNQYPQTIDPILMPGEEQVYEWRWTADAVYGQAGVLGVQATVATAVFGPGDPIPQGNNVNMGVGVRAMPGGEVSAAGIECADMRR